MTKHEFLCFMWPYSTTQHNSLISPRNQLQQIIYFPWPTKHVLGDLKVSTKPVTRMYTLFSSNSVPVEQTA